MAGVEARSVGLSQVVLPPKTTIAVVKRMSAVQETLANLEESRGQAEADAIKSQAASQADTIRNFADQWAAEIEAVGNTEATRYYEQMKQEADLAIFLAWLDTLRASLTGSTTFVTDMTKAPFHMIDLDSPTDANGIPQPQQRSFQGGSEK
jgi:regulator of protease activity HflC (stomatin/prohibitin superfamily)